MNESGKILSGQELSQVSGGADIQSTVKRCNRFKCRDCGAVPYSVKYGSDGGCSKCYVTHRSTCKYSLYGYCSICAHAGESSECDLSR